MRKSQRNPSDSFLEVRPTEGDFPHVRRRSLRLACCTCTTCSFTLVLGGIGGIAGVIAGIVAAANANSNQALSSPLDSPNAPLVDKYGAPRGGCIESAFRVVVMAIAYGVAGLLIGAAIGFGIDFLTFNS